MDLKEKLNNSSIMPVNIKNVGIVDVEFGDNVTVVEPVISTDAESAMAHSLVRLSKSREMLLLAKTARFSPMPSSANLSK